jgi:phage tail sheath gpL-like
MKKINYMELIRTAAAAQAIGRDGRGSLLHKKISTYCAIKNYINYKRGWI